ncbi:helix-turn-helix domain-containing protein [Solidesulfovibrio sp. C21]|uniref:AraC family transcriptional regulator n=1 Tax=Solidesulfovibrio sp. C21 TaxID=3398613 RepID=UPI0039FC878F
MPRRTASFAPELLRRREDPDLPGLVARLAAYRRRAFSRHIHDAWCVGLILSGATRLRQAGGLGRITAGETALIAPGEPHACNPEPDGRLAYVMFFLEREAVRLVGVGDEPAFRVPLVRDPVLAARLSGLYRAMTARRDRLEKQSLLCLALAPLFSRTEHLPGPPGRGLARVRDYLREHWRDKVSLTELAELAGQSPSHVLRLFKREYGLPPHAYQSFLRVERAKALLAGTDLPAAAVAQEVGFADQSHLIRTFTPQVGATPNQYRLSLRRARPRA